MGKKIGKNLWRWLYILLQFSNQRKRKSDTKIRKISLEKIYLNNKVKLLGSLTKWNWFNDVDLI